MSAHPWPPPDRAASMFMRWHDLLFMHWSVPAQAVQALLGPSLPVDTFDGRAWIGVVPFRMSGVCGRWLPPLPGLSAFPELNVRTYVSIGGKPGVYFFSLDATSRIAIETARRAFGLNYLRARMQVVRRHGWLDYRSIRIDRRGAMLRPPREAGPAMAELALRYRPIGEAFRAQPGTLDRWLTERYCLYTLDRTGRVLRGEIQHGPWPLRRAMAQIRTNTMTAPLGIALPATLPVLHFARRLDVAAWRPTPA